MFVKKMVSANNELANVSHTPFCKRGRDRSSDEMGPSQTTCAQYTNTAASQSRTLFTGLQYRKWRSECIIILIVLTNGSYTTNEPK